eukprot:TRINITY_DN8938_c0_g2_i1.p2 TRINITY_DN8938_c0_g2~~TRINITY_DN8938_c0_g2_i1.p2  ORF type:complete len:157 (-),score=35.53 TRINITY_DN8938_c0_g2_i1:329-739(-)
MCIRDRYMGRVHRKNDMYSLCVQELSAPSLQSSMNTSRLSFFGGKDKFNLLNDNSNDEGDRDEHLIKLLRDQVHELSRRLKAEQERNICIACMEREINSVFLECGHRSMCYSCSSWAPDCPICRRKPTRIIKIFTA